MRANKRLLGGLAIAVVLAGATPPSRSAAPPGGVEVRRLIAQLGSDQFARREAADKRLEAMGEPVWDALRKAAKASADLEVRQRARRIAAAIARRCFGEIRSFEGHTEQVNCVRLSADGRRMLSAGLDGVVRLWSVDTGKKLRTMTGQPGGVWALALSPDGKRGLSGTGIFHDGTKWVAATDFALRVWDLSTAKELRRLRGHTAEVRNAALSPDGKRALSASLDGTLRLWDVETGKELRQFTGHTRAILGVAFSPDGKRALSSGSDLTLRLWEVETGKELRCFRGHANEIFSVAFSPDGKRALSGSADGTLRLWDVETGKELRCLRGHTTVVWSAAFSPDGRRAVSGGGSLLKPTGYYGPAGFDYAMRLWDLDTGEELLQYEGHTNAILSVRFSPDGRRAFSASSDRTVRMWKTPR